MTDRRRAAPGNLRSATLADLPGLAAVERACFPDPWSEPGLRAELELPHSRVYVCTDFTGILQATLLGWRVFEEFHVNRVAVHPEARRLGLGRWLLLHALTVAKAEGVESALLEVRADNLAAIQLYETTGFLRTGLRRGYYPDGTHALLMTLDLWAWKPR